MLRRPPRSTLFPYTRSSDLGGEAIILRVHAGIGDVDIVGRILLPIVDARKCPRTVKRHRLVSCSRAMWLKGDRKSTRLNSSHVEISYAVFCLKKKKKNNIVE